MQIPINAQRRARPEVMREAEYGHALTAEKSALHSLRSGRVAARVNERYRLFAPPNNVPRSFSKMEGYDE